MSKRQKSNHQSKIHRKALENIQALTAMGNKAEDVSTRIFMKPVASAVRTAIVSMGRP